MSMADRYTESMYKEHKMFAAWPPIEKYGVGDFGKLEGRTLLKRGSRFTRYGNLATTEEFQKIRFKTRLASSPKSALTYVSSGSVNYAINPNASAGTGNPAKGDLEISFSSKNSIFFYAENITIESIDDKGYVFRKIVSLYKQKHLPKDFVLITDIIKAGNTTVYISGDADASVSLDANISGSVSTGPINFGAAGIQFEIRSKKNIAYDLTSAPGLTPFFSLYGILDGSDPKMQPMKAGSLLNVLQYDSMVKDQSYDKNMREIPTVAFVKL